ncbi:hypothetical protein WG899_16045 [Paucibacter sp. AS339]|uniref:hypothetical protein n=1 Tax=Paucibacter hankyongi TaxID=3133434 RepID=UPI0030A5DF76
MRIQFRTLFAICTALTACSLPTSAAADPGYYLVTPYSQPGQAGLDLRYWTVKAPGYEATLWPELGLRYGINSRWTSELLLSYIGEMGSRQTLSSVNWLNDLMLTQGEHAFDLALHTQLIRNHDSDTHTALELGPALQTEWGHTQLNFNLFLEHDWGNDKGTQLKYQWQALHRLKAGVRLGLQGFGELGNWSDWAPQNRQSHRAGPTLRLGLPLAGEQRSLNLQLAYLWGRVYGQSADMFSAQLLYSF